MYTHIPVVSVMLANFPESVKSVTDE